MVHKALMTAALLALGAGTAHARTDQTPDKLLAGRTPGKPVQCIIQTQISDSQTFDDGTIYYRMRGPIDYVNKPHDCPQLNSSRAYSTRTPSNQLCSGDIMTVFDAGAHLPYGSCIFNEFVPYPRIKKPKPQ
jgi:hypothetical protein